MKFSLLFWKNKLQKKLKSVELTVKPEVGINFITYFKNLKCQNLSLIGLH